MKKSKVILIGVASAAAVLVVVTGILTVLGLSSASESKDKLEQVRRKLDSFYKMNPFPNSENIAVENDNLAKVTEWNKELYGMVSDGGYVAAESDPTPGSFRILREQTIAELTEKAPRADGAASIIPADFSFGFDRYKDGTPAAENEVPRLIKQLTLIRQLVEMLYGCDIMKLEAVRREGFERSASSMSSGTEDSSEGGRSGRRRVRTRDRAASQSDTFSPVVWEDGAVPVDRQRFEFVFVAKQASLLKVLNAIESMKPFAMISSLSFSKTGKDVIVAGAGTKDAAGAKPQAPQASAQQPALVNARPPSRTARLVSGRLKESPVRVVLGVDVFTFGTDEKSAESEDAADSSGTDDSEM